LHEHIAAEKGAPLWLAISSLRNQLNLPTSAQVHLGCLAKLA
jgi:hypothetical protein